jgi:hypothetical protein
MNPLTKPASVLPWIVAVILVLVPFHAFLTVYLASLVGHYTLLRLWDEFLLAILAVGSIILIFKDRQLRVKLFSWRLVQLILFYSVLTIVWGLVAYAKHQVTTKALGYGLIVNLRFLIFFICTYAVASKNPILKLVWPKLLLIPAGIVIIVGLLQRLVLPYDFLKHFGYNSSTIFPYEDINHNIHFPRIMATLRGANPLGVYAVLIITCVAAFWLKFKKQRLLWSFFGVGAFLVLIFSYSRGAWVGALASLLALIWMSFKNKRLKQMSLAIAGALAIIAVVLAFSLRNNVTFQNVVFHTQKNSVVKTTSDQGHASGLKSGLDDVLHEPFGRGPGTAGPASVYNNKTRIAENYFIQIGQEVGWLGLALFLAISYLAAKELWLRRADTLSAILLASLLGITVVNLLSHAWADDTLCYLWWGLAGIALSAYTTTRQKTYGKKQKT